jgi:hypothetical protein
MDHGQLPLSQTRRARNRFSKIGRNGALRHPPQGGFCVIADAAARRPLPQRIGFASRGGSFYDADVLELEVYAAGVRDLNKILELDIELEGIPGLYYKVDRNHDVVYMQLEWPSVTFREIRSTFRKLGLEPKFVGAIPAELRPKTKTQPLGP